MKITPTELKNLIKETIIQEQPVMEEPKLLPGSLEYQGTEKDLAEVIGSILVGANNVVYVTAYLTPAKVEIQDQGIGPYEWWGEKRVDRSMEKTLVEESKLQKIKINWRDSDIEDLTPEKQQEIQKILSNPKLAVWGMFEDLANQEALENYEPPEQEW